MLSKFVWKDRRAMIERGKRLILANWGNKKIDGRYIESCHRDVWFTRNLGRYGYWRRSVRVQASDMVIVQNMFWSEVIARLEDEYGVG
jgi:hypothetical protein